MAAAPSPAASTSPLPPEVSLAPPQPLPPDHPATSPSAQPNASPPLGGASLTPPPPPQSVSPQRQSSSPVNGLPPPVSDTPPPPPSPPPPQNSPSATPGLPSPLPPPLSDPPTSSPPTTPSISYPPQSSAPPSSSPPPQSDPQVSSPLSSSSPPSSGSPENPMRPVPPAAASSPPNNSLPIPAAVPPRSSPPKRSPNAPGNSSPPASSTTPSSPSHGGSKTALAVAIAVGAGLAVLCFMLVLLLLRKRQNKKQKKIAPGLNGGYVIPAPLDFTPRTDSPVRKPNSAAPLIGSSSSSDFIHVPPQPGGLWNSRSWFTYDELYKATDGFSAGNLLGEGGFGPVYKGYLPDGQVVAVKQLKVGGGQGEREFKAEVEIITRIHHRHLVSLVGYCVSENRRLLAYDYVPNNTLHFHLHEADNPVMDWATRIKVAAGAARGLAYLHEDCPTFAQQCTEQ